MKITGTFQIISGKPSIIISRERRLDIDDFPILGCATLLCSIMSNGIPRELRISGKVYEEGGRFFVGQFHYPTGSALIIELLEGDTIVVDDETTQELEMATQGGEEA